jgi:hypothetical protein
MSRQEAHCSHLAHRPRGGTGSDGRSMEASHTESLAATCFRPQRGEFTPNCSNPLAAIKGLVDLGQRFSHLLARKCSTSYGQRACLGGGRLATLSFVCILFIQIKQSASLFSWQFVIKPDQISMPISLSPRTFGRFTELATMESSPLAVNLLQFVTSLDIP